MHNFSEIFYNFTAGIGIFFAGVSGAVLLYNWLVDLQKKRQIETLKKRFPFEKKDQTYRLIRSLRTGDKIYIYIPKDNKKFWIKNAETYWDMGFMFGNESIISDNELEKIPEGPPIVTR